MAKEGLMTAEQVAEYLQCSASWVRRLASSGQMPHYRLGALLRFRSSEVDRWLAEHHFGPVEGSKHAERGDINQLSLFDGEEQQP